MSGGRRPRFEAATALERLGREKLTEIGAVVRGAAGHSGDDTRRR
jgi:hypothetical protein